MLGQTILWDEVNRHMPQIKFTMGFIIASRTSELYIAKERSPRGSIIFEVDKQSWDDPGRIIFGVDEQSWAVEGRLDHL